MSEAPPSKAESVPDDSAKQQARSGLTYSLVTKYWPRIAAGLVGLAVVAEWVIGGLTSNGALEFYVFAWATTTGGLWFLFEKAEKALSEESRDRVVAWMQERDLGSAFQALPSHFALLFDRVFGEKHWSRRCFERSIIASFAAVIVAFTVLASLNPGVLTAFGDSGELWDLVTTFFVYVMLSVFFNVLPDYVSLLETRIVIGYMRGSLWRILGLVIVDGVVTNTISLASVWAVMNWFLMGMGLSLSLRDALSIPLGVGSPGTMVGVFAPIGVVFFSSRSSARPAALR